MRVYRAHASLADLKDPRKAIAALEGVDVKGRAVTARRVPSANAHSVNAHNKSIQPGDPAIQIRPGDNALTLTVRIRLSREPRGVDMGLSHCAGHCHRSLHTAAYHLVYRDAGRKVGHVVMVIDPEKRIAWGSHGWDGNVKEQSSVNPVPVDKGVEYQRIKYKKDSERWDRTTMQRVACWRYKQFVTDAASPGGRPGMAALNEPCEARSCQ